MKIQPDILTMNDGQPVRDPSQWAARRAELIELFTREEYGRLPSAPARLSGAVLQTQDTADGEYAAVDCVRITFDTPTGEFALPMRLYRFADGEKHPVFLLLHYGETPDDRFPFEEISRAGVVLAVVSCGAIAADNADFTTGLAGHYPRKGNGDDWGKLGMWAWGVSRCVDYLLQRADVDASGIAVVGHSRLGKAVLLAAALDERVQFAFINDSGCGGAALERCKREGAETIAFMNDRFPYWFCENRAKYAKDISAMPFDQHFVLAAIAPRFACVGAAVDDGWSDPYGMQLACVGASDAWQLLGKKGFCGSTAPARAGDAFLDGCVAYHLREGGHDLNRTDWLTYLAFFEKHKA